MNSSVIRYKHLNEILLKVYFCKLEPSGVFVAQVLAESTDNLLFFAANFIVIGTFLDVIFFNE